MPRQISIPFVEMHNPAQLPPQAGASSRENLRERILSFVLDDPQSSLPFSSRLAREQGWTHAYAGRVSFEYRRFLVLLTEAEHPVTPSEAVDHAWHLHLLYTRSYWVELCQKTLGRELHHEPTRGGAEEGAKFVDWYSKTLSTYQRIFQEPAPAEIWPSPAERFQEAGMNRWVDVGRFYLVPKPSFVWSWLRKAKIQ